MTSTKRVDMRNRSGPVLHSPRPEMKIRLSSSVLRCANQNVKSITLGQREITANEILYTHTESGPWWVLVSPAGDIWRGGTDSSLTDMQERELKCMSTQTLYSHLCSDYNIHSRSEGTTVDMNWQNMFLIKCLILLQLYNKCIHYVRDNPRPGCLSQTFCRQSE